jgi:hypothetical protein
MRLSTEVTVAAPLERAWPALLELGGPLTLELGGRWEVSARLDDVDEDEHAAGFHLVGHEHGGNGMAAATILARANGGGDATRIAFDTDVRLTGAAERPDQETAQAAADELLARLAAHLEGASGSDPPEAPAPEVSDPSSPRRAASKPLALDLTVMAGHVAERALLVTAGLALGLAVGRLLWRRR